jgi:DNA-binding Xre family transcriptional regulator
MDFGRHHISSATIDKLRKIKPMYITFLNDLCRILDCRLEDITEYTSSPEDQML